MKYILILTILLLSGCYLKRIESLEQNQKVMVDAVNTIGARVFEKEIKEAKAKEEVKK